MIHHPREDNFVFKMAEAQYMAWYLFSHRITVITIMQHLDSTQRSAQTKNCLHNFTNGVAEKSTTKYRPTETQSIIYKLCSTDDLQQWVCYHLQI